MLNNSPSYRRVPAFGCDTIRRFGRNVSELKRMAARDFEDLLQVQSSISFAKVSSSRTWLVRNTSFRRTFS